MRLLMVFMLDALQLPGATIYLNGPASVYEACLQGATLSDVQSSTMPPTVSPRPSRRA